MCIRDSHRFQTPALPPFRTGKREATLYRTVVSAFPTQLQNPHPKKSVPMETPRRSGREPVPPDTPLYCCPRFEMQTADKETYCSRYSCNLPFRESCINPGEETPAAYRNQKIVFRICRLCGIPATTQLGKAPLFPLSGLSLIHI